jgi:TatD DNase family protein
MEFIDTHAHIYLDSFEDDISEVLQRANAQGVSRIFLPNIDTSSIGVMLDLEEKHPGYCLSLIGLHPCSVKEDFEDELNIMEQWLGRRVFAGIGEAGTDLYWDKTYQEQQIETLKIQIQWAKRYGIPIILHSRNSLDLTISVIEKNHSPGLAGIFHCFSGSLEQAEKIIELGFYLGIGGVVTFKNSGLGNLLKNIPLKYIVLETDSPYLAPVPFRGKRNEPSYVLYTAERLAEVYQISIEEIANITTNNARKIFKDA